MSGITIYTTGLCAFCYRAKALLDGKGVAYEEIDVTFRPKHRAEMAAKAGGETSVPQIWIGERHIGGSEELQALESAGELDRLLTSLA
ncbi:MAG: glutaredoxin 3 [Alphaproteobacteria bacterium]|nr:glutaredoxin 3 [Alphaproteobacteria bacterium]